MVKPQRHPEFRVNREDDEINLFNEREGHTIRVDEVALTVWHLCDGYRDVDEIIGLLRDAYPEAASSISRDVVEAIESLRNMGALFVPLADTSDDDH